MSPEDTQYHQEEQHQTGSDCVAVPPTLPPPRDFYGTVTSTLAQAIDAEQYYERALEDVLATQATLQGSRQEKGRDNEWSPQDYLFLGDTYGDLDAFLVAAAPT